MSVCLCVRVQENVSGLILESAEAYLTVVLSHGIDVRGFHIWLLGYRYAVLEH